jgi:hypothetical protein
MKPYKVPENASAFTERVPVPVKLSEASVPTAVVIVKFPGGGGGSKITNSGETVAPTTNGVVVDKTNEPSCDVVLPRAVIVKFRNSGACGIAVAVTVPTMGVITLTW